MKGYGKRILWTAGIVIMCLCDQQIGSALGERQLIFRMVPIIVIGLIGLSHYPIKSYCRPMYYVWAVISLVAAVAVTLFFRGRTYYPRRLLFGVFLGVVYGFLILRTAHAIFGEKIRPTVNKWYLGLFAAFLMTVLTSRYDDYLSILYLAFFVVVYLTAFSTKEKKQLGDALIDGIIIGFLIIQGLAFVFRPYDTLRYLGMYSNTNINALMYQTVYCAFLGRFCLLEKKNCRKEDGSVKALTAVWKWMCFVLAACMWGFVFLTMCRSAMISMAVITVMAWTVRLRNRKGKKLLAFGGNTLLFGIVLTVGLPVVYGAVRYLPPLFHHPLYFYEGYSEDRIQYNDPWDSPKYTTWSEVIEQNMGRFADLIPGLSLSDGGDDQKLEVLSHVDKSAALWSDNLQGEKEHLYGSLPEEEDYLGETSVHARVKIYQYYLSKLNLRGHREAENGLQVNEDYYAPHAHNVFLQYAFNYGVIGGILFLAMMTVVLIFLRKGNIGILLLYSAVFIFGLTEIVWRNGTLSYCLMYLIPVLIGDVYDAETSVLEHIALKERVTCDTI